MNIVLGHEAQEKLLIQHFNNQKLHHSLIFNGQEGIGKASFALNFVKFMLSNSPKDKENFAQMIDAQTSNLVNKLSHPNLLYIHDTDEKGEKKSIGVEEIRAIKVFNQLSSAYSGKKIIIIDSINNCTHNAVNSLLKVLEEPNHRTMFILISHNVDNILNTVSSRSIKIPFYPLSEKNMKEIITNKLNLEFRQITNNYLLELIGGSIKKYLTIIQNESYYTFLDTFTKDLSGEFNRPLHKIILDINAQEKTIKLNYNDIFFLINLIISQKMITEEDRNQKYKIESSLIEIKKIWQNIKSLNLSATNSLLASIFLLGKNNIICNN